MLTYIEALLPDNLEIYFMQFLCYTVINLLYICYIPHLASYITLTSTGYQNHTEKETASTNLQCHLLLLS